MNGLIAQAVLTDGEKGSGVAPKWGAFVAAMSGILIACGASGTNETKFNIYTNFNNFDINFPIKTRRSL